ncbi:MAG: hypothetical protein AAFV19_07515 [Pseudomonadota bacterium]
MAITTDILADEDHIRTGFLSRLGQIFESFRAAQEVAAAYEQTHTVRGNERAIFDRAFSRI